MSRTQGFIFFIALCFFCDLSSYGLLQGRTRERQDQDERAFLSTIYQTYSPFYTGPLLAPSAHTVPKGLFNVQPYLFWQKTYGEYDRKWKQQHIASSVSLQSLSVIQYGLTDFMDVNVLVQGWYKQSGNQHYYSLGDTQVSVGFQMLRQFVYSAWPACVIEVGTTFPTGRYEHLSPMKNGTDSGGGGSYSTSISLNLQKNFNKIFRKVINPLDFHPFLFRLSAAYNFPSRVEVEGLNTYGGTHQTKGKITVGNTFVCIFAWEYSLTEHWVFATDWQYTASRSTNFAGTNGGESIGSPASQSWSVAPAIEYNINSNAGVLAGVWFSFAGRNSSQFVNGIFSFTWAW